MRQKEFMLPVSSSYLHPHQIQSFQTSAINLIPPPPMAGERGGEKKCMYLKGKMTNSPQFCWEQFRDKTRHSFPCNDASVLGCFAAGDIDLARRIMIDFSDAAMENLPLPNHCLPPFSFLLSTSGH